MKKSIVLIILCIFVFTSCSMISIKPPPSICDNMPAGERVLCDIVKKYDIHLETTGAIIGDLNLAAIQAGQYNAKDAGEFISNLKKDFLELAKDGITAMELKNLIVGNNSYPPGMFTLNLYLNYLSVDTKLTDTDIQILENYFDMLMGNLNSMY